MPEQSPERPAAPKKAWYMRWWIWLIGAVILIGAWLIGAVILFGLIGLAFGLGADEPTATESISPAPAEETTVAPGPEETASGALTGVFDDRFASVCAAVTSGFESVGTVTCGDATTWQANHDRSPDVFPFEYRDISVDIGGQVALEVKVIADSSTLDHFRAEYTCDSLFGGEGSCVVDEAGQDTLFSVIIYGAQDDTQANELAASLKQALESAQ